MSTRSTARPFTSATTHLAPTPSVSNRSGRRAPSGRETGSPLAMTCKGSGPGGLLGCRLGRRLHLMLVGAYPAERFGVGDVGYGLEGRGLTERAGGLLPAGRP